MTGFIRERDLPEGGTSLRSASFGQLSKNPCFHAVKAGVLLQFVEK